MFKGHSIFIASAFLTLSMASSPATAQSSDISESYQQRLRELLRNQGYNRIEFQDLSGDTLSANACSEEESYRITLNLNGRVLERSETGECTLPLPEQSVADEQIIDTLYGRGYLRITIVDRTPPTLLVNACRGDRKYQVRIDDDGDVIDAKEDGECDIAAGDPLTTDQIRHILSLQGYRNIRMTESGDSGFHLFTACNGVREFNLRVNEHAQINMRKAASFCDTAEQSVEYIPPSPVDDTLVNGTGQLDPESCQMVLDWLQYERPITFSTESATLTDEDDDLVSLMTKTVERCSSARVLIEGHTSRTGDDAFNQDLSEKRALAVQQAFLDTGIVDDRMAARGFGESYPRIPNDSNAELNRRIEIQLEWDSSETDRS